MKKLSVIYSFLLIYCIHAVNSQAADSPVTPTAAGACQAAQESCNECLLASPDCSWCSDTNTSAASRCRLAVENSVQCPPEYIENPEGSVEATTDDPFSASVTYTETSAPIVIQLKPQLIDVKLRQGKPEKVNITFRRVVDYPLDLYYVMDLSYSMRDDLQKLKQLGINLARDIQNVTANVRLGFGTFVDKVIMPYASTVPAQLKDPCSNFGNESITCAPVFGFRNQLNITADATAFRDSVQGTQISGNIDSPEGGFDALMQIAVCQEQIQWRKNALRVILMTTDSSSHIAMDGKLAAILDVNDMKCHLEKGFNTYIPNAYVYSKSRLQDYPSIGQLKKAFDDNKIQTIFAVTEEVVPLYKGVQSLIENTFVRRLNNDSSNVVDVVSETYATLRDKITFTEPVLPAGVDMNISYRILCPGRDWADNTLTCNNTQLNQEAVLEFTLLANGCPSDPSQKYFINVTSGSIQDEAAMRIDFVSCECECSKTTADNSSSCSDRGSLTCGICSCNPGSSGQQCQCTGSSTQDFEEQCKERPDKKELCNGNGQCVCGKCDCDTNYQGEFCECRSTGCPEDCGKTAGQGTCRNCYEDRQCYCVGNYTLNKITGICSCIDDKCVDKGSNSTAICRGRGTCNCDRCNCTVEYIGKFCETCTRPSCSGLDGTCGGSVISNCAECVYEKQRLNKDIVAGCFDKCEDNGITFRSVDSLPDCGICLDQSNSLTTAQIKLCTTCNSYSRDPDIHIPVSCEHTSQDSGCDYKYRIYWNKNRYEFVIYVKTFDRETDCPKAIDPLLIVLPVIGVILLIGLLALLLWKVFQTIRDKHEYEQFMENQKMSQWSKGENPLFTKPTDRIENPAYVG